MRPRFSELQLVLSYNGAHGVAAQPSCCLASKTRCAAIPQLGAEVPWVEDVSLSGGRSSQAVLLQECRPRGHAPLTPKSLDHSYPSQRK